MAMKTKIDSPVPAADLHRCWGHRTVSAELADEDIPDAIEIIRLINEYRASQGLNP